MATSVRRDHCPKASVPRSGSKGQCKASINPAGSKPVCVQSTGTTRQKPLKLFGPSVAPVVLFVLVSRRADGLHDWRARSAQSLYGRFGEGDSAKKHCYLQ